MGYRIKVNLKNGEIEVEGDKEFVKDEIEKLLERIVAKFSLASSLEMDKDKKDVLTQSGAVTEQNMLFESFAEFYKAIDPKKEQDKSLIAVYWFNKFEGKDAVTPKDVVEILKDAGVPLPSNISRDLRELASGKKAYLIKVNVKGGRPAYKLSMTGENYVNKLLRVNE
ncbi:hypothetical protein GAH_01388 [Geoglobus ahangari]|uniref:Uncharacterized protein n=2 Tax=Geoglobus ahangari TaxID=113653 RepID=A0A0F7IEC9_9EURY|nr:hypothetical protein GAH_01388 [Geoglobus ahangari]